LAPERESLIPGTLNVLILKTLSLGPRHGYGISKWIGETTADVFQVEEGVMYPALHRLERDGLISSEWLRAPTGRRAKFYALTAAGERALATEMARWERSSGAVHRVLRAEG
jgi:PadR family transcriptional regulator PadR